MTLAVARALGWLAIAHGLSHAVLPLRGSLAPAIAIGDWTPLLLYTVSMGGFVAAGLGLLGLRPLDRAISPMLVLSSGLSIVAIQRLGHADLWIGGAFDVAFFFLGLWRAYAGWPAGMRRHARVWHVLGLTFGFAFLGYVATATMLWPWHRTWGSTRAEVAMTLPGDRPMRDPSLENSGAVRQTAVVWFMRPVNIGDRILMGKYIIEHNTHRMARGLPCTHIYAAADQRRPVVVFHCTHLERPRTDRATVTVVSTSDPTGLARFTEFQFAGETAAHGVPTAR